MKPTLNQTVLLALFSAAIGMTTIQAQTPIPSTFALPSSAADASKPGFIWRTHASGGALPDTFARLESQLAGLLGDNHADLNAVGPALAPAAPANPSTAPVTFEIPTVINLSQVDGGLGNFDTDSILPGIPPTVGASDGIAGEALTWLDLPAGTITMGVNSDDGFRVSIGGAAPQDKFNNINVGQFQGGRGAADTIFTFTITQAGLYAARLIWEEGGGDANVEWFTQAADGTKTLVNDVGGIKAYRAVTTPPAKAYVRTAIPLPGFTGVAPNGSVKAEVVDGATPIDPTTVKLTLDGTALPDTGAKVGNATTISFTPTTPYSSASQHTVVLTYSESGSVVTQTWTFAVPAYITIAPGSKVTPDTSKPGFVWNIFQNEANQETSNARAAAALAGQLKDDTGAALPNLADPATVGVALAAASAANPANAPLRFEIATVINLTQNSTDAADNANGNFTPDQQMPGIPPGDANGIAAEAITYIELPAGLVAMGVNSDDGFQTTLGIDAIRAPLLGVFDAGRGAADTIFYFFVQEAGVYPFRTLWEEGGGGANIEWFTVKTDGTKVLVNDTANGGLKAYRALSGTQNPYVKYVSPGTEPRQLNKFSSAVIIVIADGTNPVDLNSVALKIDGQDVTTANTRVGTTVQAIYAPTTLQIPADIHTAALTYKDSTGGFTGNPQWQFRNLKNLVLPAPKITENFDSYPEDTQPTGWVATNFTSQDGTARDITDQKSQSYENWVLVSTDNMTGLDGGSANVAPGQTFNGQPVTSIASGNVLYAESDGRSNTDGLGRGYAGQAQFIVSKAFDCSQIPNVAITLSVLYTQNQDNIGAIEYSVDGGNSWLPVVYFIDILDGGGDVKYNADGSVDAVATFTSANADTANWVVNGVAKGDNYGDGIAAPITAALGDFVAPRLNDNQFEAARIEVFRLAQAGGKSDVRLRFAQLGTDSWWFAIDNLAFYDVPGGVQPPPTGGPTIAIARSGTSLTLSWPASDTGFTLESTDSLSNPTWTAVPGVVNNSVTVQIGAGSKFYRLRK